MYTRHFARALLAAEKLHAVYCGFGVGLGPQRRRGGGGGGGLAAHGRGHGRGQGAPDVSLALRLASSRVTVGDIAPLRQPLHCTALAWHDKAAGERGE